MKALCPPPPWCPTAQSAPSPPHPWLLYIDLREREAQLSPERLLPWLSDEECQRHERYVFEHSRQEFRVARVLLRFGLSALLPEYSPRVWHFELNPWGRPELAAPFRHHGLRFNLSHTRTMVAALFAFEREVGLDVEDITRSGAPVTLADRYFSEPECQHLRALPKAMQREAFFRYWTLKEAYIKARGMGLALPLQKFGFDFPDAATVGLWVDASLKDTPTRWSFACHSPTSCHRLASAIECHPERALPPICLTAL